MHAELLISRILDDEGLTGDLAQEAAAALVAWLVQQTETIAEGKASEPVARAAVEDLCRRGRAMAHLVTQVCQGQSATDELACLQELLAQESDPPS